MAITISSYVQQLAYGASQDCGLDENVILAQWHAEEGVSSTSDWPNNNPAGIRPGNSSVDALSTGVSAYGFDIFPTPAAGAKAYATLYNSDINYAGVRDAIHSGSPTLQLQAIVQSGWDAGHYGGDGHTLYNSYKSITGQSVTITSDNTPSTSQGYGAVQGSAATQNQVDIPPSNYGIVANSQKTGDILYGRKYRVIVSDSTGVSLDVSDLHVQFTVIKTINQQPPYSTIIIYNLDPQTENFILNEGNKIYIEAGYEGSQYGLIFDGDIIIPIRDKADNVSYRLTLYCFSADRQLNQSFAGITIKKGQSARSVVKHILGAASVPTEVGFLSNHFSETTLPRGKTVFGMTRDYLRQIAHSNSMAFYAEDGKVNFVHATDLPKGEIYDLTPQNGLIGEPAQENLGVAFRSLMNPNLTINSFVHIDNQYIMAQAYQIGQVPRNLDSQGIYRVIYVEHSGDTRGDSWFTGCTTVSQAGGIPGSVTGAIPGMISSAIASPW